MPLLLKRALLLLAAFLSCLTLGAATASQFYYATDEELGRYAELRGLGTGSREELLERLYQYEGLEAYQEELEESGDFSLTILGAESVRSQDGVFLISGNGSLVFRNGGQVASLSADNIILDTVNGTLTALENVSYSSDSKAALSTIEADIVSLAWEKGDILVSNAVTSTERTDEDGANVTFYTTGELLSYSDSGAMVYKDGTVGLSPVDPHSSISASRIAMLPGSDLFISNAVLRIGRVPVLWLPFFLFPGTQMTGNPSFGLSSDNGMFLNTTWELFGSSGLVDRAANDASILSIANRESEGDELPKGSYYTSREPGSVQRWAEESGSYLALMADAYSELGLNFGLKSELSLFDGRLEMSFFDGLAVSEANDSYGYGNWRYYGENELEFSDFGLTVSASFPFYSDSHVLYDFGNRVTSFSVMSLLEAPEFPETYTSTKLSFNRQASISYTLPSKYRTQLVSSFTISGLEIDYDYRWSTSSLEYYLKYLTLPSFSMTLSGTIFKLSGDFGSGAVVEKTEVDVTDEYILQDPLLYDLYRRAEKKASSSSSSPGTYNVQLKYTFIENLSNEYTYDSAGEQTDQDFSSTTSLKLNFSANAGDYASFDAVLTPSLYYLYEDDDGAVVMTERASVTTDLTFAVPVIGLEYRIAGKLLNVTDYTEDEETTRTVFHPGWDDDTITTHYVSFNKSFATERFGTFTPSLKYILPPLEASIVPGLSYSYSNFKATLSWEFDENSSGGYDPGLLALSASWNSTHITSSLSLKYEGEEYDKSDLFLPLYGTASFALRTADKNWSITEYADWEYLSDDGYKNYFNHLRTTFKVPFFKLALDWQGPASDLSFYSIDAELDLSTRKFQCWKGRLYIAFGFEATFTMEIDDPYAASLELEPSITFSIAEFLDFKFSFSSENNGFYEYYDENNRFSIKEMIKDFGQSLDFFGNGRSETNFVFSTAALEITHYMHDWDLNVRYSAVVELVDDTYQFIPELTIYLRWKILPDLKIDQTWEQEDGEWIQD